MRDVKHVSTIRTQKRGEHGQTITTTEQVTRVADETHNGETPARAVPWYAWAIVAGMLGVWLALAV
jgi:hypothetical protein